MKKFLAILVLFPLMCYELHAETCDWSDHIVSDSIWIQWFSSIYDDNIEICEMRNEYLFCQLESPDCCTFISYLEVAIDETIILKLEQELQNPLNDNINVPRCVQNVMLCTYASNNIKNWLITNLRQ